MKPFRHAMVSARKHGGQPEDYIEIHNFIDSSKAAHADIRHRALLHNSFGCFIAEKVFGVPEREIGEAAERFGWGAEEVDAVRNLIRVARTDARTTVVNSDRRSVSVRDIAEEHVLSDLGHIPSVGDYLQHMTIQKWMGGNRRQV